MYIGKMFCLNYIFFLYYNFESIQNVNKDKYNKFLKIKFLL